MAVSLVDDLARALDPALLARDCGIAPDPWQADVLRASATQVLLNCSRQSGKSTCVAVKAVHRAVYLPRSLVLLICPTLRQSQELFRKCLGFYRALGRPVPADAENALTLELRGGSRIVSLPGAEGTIRGYSGVDLLLIDEAAWVPDATYRAVRPMLAVSRGQLIALSTPAGRRGWWCDEWHAGGPAWGRWRVPAHLCPRIPAAFLAEERRALGPFFAQEYECEFLDATSQLFGREFVEAAINPELEPWL